MGVIRNRNASTDDSMTRWSPTGQADVGEERAAHLACGPAVGGTVIQTYATDLTDEQWDDLCATVFPDPHPADDLRQVLNTLLYRERFSCPWQLLPTGFPPVEIIRP